MMESGNTPFVMNVEPSGCGNGGMNGWGDGGWLWFIVVIFAIFGGWGNGGYGNGGGRGAADNYTLATDFATIERKLDGVNNGLCDGFYAQNTNLLTGFAGVNQNLATNFANLQTNLCQIGNNVAQQINGVQSQIAQCCCDTQRSIDGVNYNLATQACQTRQVINDAVRSLHDEIVANRIEDKNAEIARQNQQIFALQLAASQAQQNEYLINQIKPCPVPAYPVCAPNTSYYGTFGNGCCGCNA